MGDELFPEDVTAACRVLKNYLARRGRKDRKPLRLTVAATGEIDLAWDTLAEAYQRGLDDGLRARPAEVHTDPDKYL